MDISKRVGSMQFSPIRRFNKYGFEAEANGKTVYRLNIGQPDVSKWVRRGSFVILRYTGRSSGT